MSAESLLQLDTANEEGLEGTPGLLEVERPSLGLQRGVELGENSAAEFLHRVESLELNLE